MKCDLKRV